MSLGATFDRINAGGGGTGPLIAALNRAVNHATQNGTLVVSAAGQRRRGSELAYLDRARTVRQRDGRERDRAVRLGRGPADPRRSTTSRRTATSEQSVVNVAAPGGDFVWPGNQTCTVGPITRPCFVFDFGLSPGAINNGYFFAAGTSMAGAARLGVARSSSESSGT